MTNFNLERDSRNSWGPDDPESEPDLAAFGGNTSPGVAPPSHQSPVYEEPLLLMPQDETPVSLRSLPSHRDTPTDPEPHAVGSVRPLGISAAASNDPVSALASQTVVLTQELQTDIIQHARLSGSSAPPVSVGKTMDLSSESVDTPLETEPSARIQDSTGRPAWGVVAAFALVGLLVSGYILFSIRQGLSAHGQASIAQGNFPPQPQSSQELLIAPQTAAAQEPTAGPVQAKTGREQGTREAIPSSAPEQRPERMNTRTTACPTIPVNSRGSEQVQPAATSTTKTSEVTGENHPARKKEPVPMGPPVF